MVRNLSISIGGAIQPDKILGLTRFLDSGHSTFLAGQSRVPRTLAEMTKYQVA
jgi:hypothetical protein